MARQYGCFDDEKREYVITDVKTPVKWINYIGTLSFGGFVDHTGGALLCKGDPTMNRITKYIQQMPSSEMKGTTLYLRVRRGGGTGSGQGEIFSPFFSPTLKPLHVWSCHVGLGYNRFFAESHGLRCEVIVFVPHGEAVELRDIRVKNLSNEPLEIDVVPVVEFTHVRALMQFTNADWVPQTMQSRIHDLDGMQVQLQYPFMHRDNRVNFFTANREASSFETDRAHFLGDHEYATWREPLSLLKPELGNHEANRGDNIGAFLYRLGTLSPGSEERLVVQLGQADSLEKARPTIERFRDPAAVEQAFAELGRNWQEYLSVQQVKTPSPEMDHMLNVHNPRQCHVTKNWSRYLSYYQLGLGSRGIGYRDSNQDVMGILPFMADEGKALISMLLGIQRRDGCAMHEMNPLTGEANYGESTSYGHDVNWYGDDHLWSILAVAEYLKESGDYGYLQEELPFYDPAPDGSKEKATVWEHLRRGLEFTRSHKGPHGLPLLGYADWNDTVNLPFGAESSFNACLYGKGLLEMIAICEHQGRTTDADSFRQEYADIHEAFNAHAWDGEWWIRYFDKDGNPLGSSKNDVCRIYCNGQSWPVLAGFAEGERSRKCLDSVEKELNTRFGIKVSAPSYNGFVEGVGGIATYPPGAKENGGIFLHTNPWVMIAETLMGNGERAFRYYQQINPAAKNDIIDTYEIEPYVYAQNILGDEHPQFGLGRNSWLSGTASWTYQAGTKWILGVRPEHGGLRIDPCIPPQWPGFRVQRQFRGARYHIIVVNPKGVSKGVAQMELDGKPVEGGLLPIPQGPGEHEVHVTMG